MEFNAPMMEKILTVAIPAYNAEKTLDKCLQSLLAVEIADMLELIVVNDGSSDSTRQIAEGYAERYPCSVLVVNKQNGGHGSCVNVGMQRAAGKYFRVVDSDDWVETAAFVEFIRKLDGTDADVCLSDYCKVDEVKGQRTDFVFGLEAGKVFTIGELSAIGDVLTMTALCYKTELLQARGIRLQEKTYYVDEEFCTLPLAFAQTFLYTGILVYCYLVGQVSQSMAVGNQLKHLDDKLRVILSLARFCEKTPMDAEHMAYCRKRAAAVALSICPIALIHNPDRRAGRKFCAQAYRSLKEVNATIYGAVHMKYRTYALMNRLGVSGKLLDAVQNARKGRA